MVFRLTYAKGDQFECMGFVQRVSSARQYEKGWNYRAFFLTEFKNT